jgi:hypothetical protein
MYKILLQATTASVTVKHQSTILKLQHLIGIYGFVCEGRRYTYMYYNYDDMHNLVAEFHVYDAIRACRRDNEVTG